jgi:O-antigen/teichoic acid export membrane protein
VTRVPGPRRVDYFLNVGAFGLYIAALQLIALPVIARDSTPDTFAEIVLFTAAYALITNVLGEELGNAALVRRILYKGIGRSPAADFALLLGICLLVVFGAGVMFVLSSHGGPYGTIILITTLIGVVRTFLLAVMRARSDFRGILLGNASYLIGVACATILWSRGVLESPYAVFLIGDALALLACATALLGSLSSLTLRPTPELGRSGRMFLQFGLVALIGNVVTYLDRVIILPLLGAAAMGVYFAASSLAKTVTLLMTPISGVILSRVGYMEDSRKIGVVILTLRRLPALLIGSFSLAFLASWLGVSLLYPGFLSQARPIFLPVAIATSLTVASIATRPILMRFISPRWLVGSNILYALGLVPLLVAVSSSGIVGFAWAIAASRGIQVTGYFLALWRGARES